MARITRALLLLKSMVYESTGPMEIIRFARYYAQKGLDVTVVLWGPMGILLGKKNKEGRMQYDAEVKECLDMGITFLCCDLAARIVGMDASELIDGIRIVPSATVAELVLEYQESGQLVFSL